MPAKKKPAAAPAAPEFDDDDVEASDDFEGISDEGMGDGDLAGLGSEDLEDVGEGEDDMDEGDEDDDGEDDDDDGLSDAARLKAAARRQQPAGPGPSSGAAAAGRHAGGLVADGALMMQTGTSDAAILQMETDELLSETRATYGKGSGVEVVLARLKEVLLAMPEHEVSMDIAKGFVEALGLSAEDSLTIKPPASVTVVGSYATRTAARPCPTVDVAIQLPTDFLTAKAHLNYRYHARRAVYLVAVARHLRDVSYSLFGEQRLEALHGDPSRPALLLAPAKADGFRLRLLPAVAPTTFALPRLAPDRNGVRAHAKPAAAAAAVAASKPAAAKAAGEAANDQPQAGLPTPHYNASILMDMLLPVHAARLREVVSGPSAGHLGDALLLLKVWARQHGLMPPPPPFAADSSASRAAAAPASKPAAAGALAAATAFGGAAGGCLDGCVLSMLVLLLAERNKLSGAMSALQAFRAALALLADGAAWSKGLVLARHQAGLQAAGVPAAQLAAAPPVSAFKSQNAVVFVDFTGFANVAAHMTKGGLAHAQHVARRTLALLDAPADPDEAFGSVFLSPACPAAAFDYQWAVRLPPAAHWPWPSAPSAAATGAGADEDGGSGGSSLCRDRALSRDQEAHLEQLARQALTDRAKVVRVLRRPTCPTAQPDDLARGLVPLAGESGAASEEEDAGPESGSGSVSIPIWVGAVLDPLLACRLVDIGPSADDGPAAARFRRFWGERSELRRWADGKITETAVWELPQAQRHTIPDIIMRHVATRHLPVGAAVATAAGALDWALSARACPAGSGTDVAAAAAAAAAAEKLSKQLRALEGLALKVVSVQPLSGVARGTAPLPPQPHPLAGGAGAGKAADGGGIPRCLDPIEVLVTLEDSGRWPDDAAAFRKMKAALGLQLASTLSASYGHHVSASEEAVDVLLDGFAFRLVLYSGRDEAMLERLSAAAASGASGAAAATAAAAAAATPALAAAATAALAAAGGSAAGVNVGTGLLSPEESPLLLTWHHGLVSQVAGANAAYAPAARLAGRWVAAHMMSNHVSAQAVELLVAAAFGGAGVPATPPPGSRVTGFLRFLQLLARWPWQLKPLVVDPARELKEPDRRAVTRRFEERRAAGDAPALYICTPRDRDSRHWTSRGPSAPVLQRLSVLAARSAAVLELLLQPPYCAATISSATDAASSAAVATCAAYTSACPQLATPSGLPAEWAAVFATPAADFNAFILLRKEALPHADLALLAAPRDSPTVGALKKAATAALAASGLAALLLPPGGAVRDLLLGAAGGADAAVQHLDAPASGPDALSDALEDAPPLEPPPKRARAFLRAFPDKVVAAKGAAKLQPELLVGFDPVARLLAELAGSYGHLGTFCVDGLGGRLVGVRWAPDAFLPAPLRLNTAHTALPLMLTSSSGAEQAGGGKAGARLCVPNIIAVLREVKELGLGLVEDVVMPPSSAKARAAW
ncbi:hypothetical protein HYH02_009758 [Chlamydomonas schloesseri]|uniref:U3 small nucleolar RNA-associated protein 22 n=1 Tax=Chlamydomonas schloesseri TaxID=2026947 RepID=A0A835TK30_9CHLO|nr:hypothetical protein HYH02_009758 [Chlamydomonas schloesseri]|eukprot:KAG2441964.1 hypothetical protein HYH02_009758 [Chlamydomonas schloesseri]